MFVPVLNILDELEAEPSTLAKQEIIKKYKDHKEFIMTLRAALDPMIVYHIKKIPDYDVGKPLRTLSRAIKQLDKFSDRVYSGNRAVKHLQELLTEVEFDDAQVLERIIKKDLRCKTGAKLVNKALGKGFIPLPVYSGCKKYTEKSEEKIPYPAYAQTKMDGLYANPVVEKGKIVWLTRKMKTLNIYNEKLNRDVLSIVSRGVLGGELLISDGKGGYLPRKTGNGIINSLSRFDEVYENAPEKKKLDIIMEYEKYLPMLRYVMWDFIPLDVFRTGEGKTAEYSSIHKMLSTFNLENSLVKYVETEIVDDSYEAEQFYERQRLLGREGAVLKSPQHCWSNKHATTQLKMKAEESADLRIKEVREGTGRLLGKLGNFLLESDDGKYSVGVGTGFSDDQREEYYTDDMIGKICEFTYNELSTSKNKSTISFTHTAFSCIRDDKDTCNVDT